MRPLSYLYSISLHWQAENYSLPGGPYPAVLVGIAKEYYFICTYCWRGEWDLNPRRPKPLIDQQSILLQPLEYLRVFRPEGRKKGNENESRSLVEINLCSRTRIYHILLSFLTLLIYYNIIFFKNQIFESKEFIQNPLDSFIKFDRWCWPGDLNPPVSRLIYAFLINQELRILSIIFSPS